MFTVKFSLLADSESFEFDFFKFLGSERLMSTSGGMIRNRWTMNWQWATAGKRVHIYSFINLDLILTWLENHLPEGWKTQHDKHMI